MMKAFTIGTSHTVNLGNFESLRIEASVTYEIPEDVRESEEQHQLDMIRSEAQAELRSLLEQTYLRQRRERKPRNEQSSEN